MGIDYKDWENLNADKQSVTLATPEYRVVSLSTAWVQMREWIHDEIDAKQEESLHIVKIFQMSGDYGYESLVKQKALMDIVQGEILMLELLAEKLAQYEHKDE